MMIEITSLLQSKLNIPRAESEMICRDRLLKRLPESLTHRATLISAPTGYGKSVLLSQYAARCSGEVVWYQLDEYDNDFSLFMHYLISGISQLYPHFGVKLLEYVESQTEASEVQRAIFALFINELEARATGGLTIIIDDFHLIHDTLICNFIGGIIEHLPHSVYLIVASRYEMPFKLSRLKSHNIISLLSGEDLKFNSDEVKTLLRSNDSPMLSEIQLNQLLRETDGWAVALSYVRRTTGDLKEKLDFLDGIMSKEEIYQYLTEEVFNQLEDNLKTFLIKTSFAEVLKPELCDAVSNRTDSAAVLERLYRENLFLTKLSGEPPSYRYHHLFQAFLQSQVEDRKSIHASMASYYLVKDKPEQAIENLLLSDNEGKAVAVIENIGFQMIRRGSWNTIKRWLCQLSTKRIASSAKLMCLQGVLDNQEGLFEKGLMTFERAIELQDKQEDVLGVNQIKFQKSILLRRSGRALDSLDVLDEILDSVQGHPLNQWYEVLLEKVNMLLWQGEFKKAASSLMFGLKHAVSENHTMLIGYMTEHLGATYYAMGEYNKAIEEYRKAHKIFNHHMKDSSEYERERYSQRTTLSVIHRDWGDLIEAKRLVCDEIEIKERLGLIDDLPRAYHQLGLIHNDSGDFAQADKCFMISSRLYRELGRKDFQWTWHLGVYGVILVSHGKTKEGEALVRKAVQASANISMFNKALCDYLACCIGLDGMSLENRVSLLEKALKIAEQTSAKNLICQCSLTLSNLYIASNQLAKASIHAKRCLALAREENYLQIFLTYPQNTRPLVKLANELNIEIIFIKRLVERLGDKSLEPLQSIDSTMSSKLEMHRGQCSIVTLGKNEIVKSMDGAVIEWKTAKAFELLAYMLKHPCQWVQKDRIQEALWPEVSPQITGKWLHTYVYQLRRILKQCGIDNGLTFKNKGYCLNTAEIYYDVKAFERLLSSEESSVGEEKIRTLMRATALCKGEFLTGFDNEWIQEERRRLEMLRLKSLEALVSLLYASERYQEAIYYANQLLGLDPVSESAYAYVIKSQRQLGNETEARRMHDRYMRVMWEELGIQPVIDF